MQNKSTDYSIPQWVCIALIVIIVAIFYHQGINLRLYHSDITAMEYVSEVFNFFVPETNFHKHDGFPLVCYAPRPLSLIPYLLTLKAVGLQQSHIVLNIFSGVLHLAVSICAFYIVKRLTGNPLIGVSSALLFASSYAARDSIYYNDNMIEPLWTFFGLLMMLSYIKYSDGKGLVNYLLSLVFFFLALLSKEPALILPAIVFILDLYLKIEKDNAKPIAQIKATYLKSIKKCLPFFCLSCLYFIFVICVYGAPHRVPSESIVSGIKGLILPTLIHSYSIQILVVLSVIIVFIAVDKRVKLYFLFTICCLLIVGLPRLIGPKDRYAYFASVFCLSLTAYVMYYGIERFLSYNVVQSFFQQTTRRRVMVAMIMCAVIMYSGLDNHVHGVILRNVRELATSDTIIHGYIGYLKTPYLLFAAFLSLIVVYIKSDKRTRSLLYLLGGCTLILMYPTFAPNYLGRFSYLPIAFLCAAAACILAYGIEKILSYRTIDQRLIVAVLLLGTIIIFRLPDYGAYQKGFKAFKRADCIRNLTSQEVKKFLVQNDNKSTLYLINFPNDLPFAWRDYTTPVAMDMVEYYCDLDTLSAELHGAKIDVGIKNPDWIGTAGTQISIEKFNELTKEPDNRILLFDYVKEQVHVIDITGMDYDSVKRLLATNDV